MGTLHLCSECVCFNLEDSVPPEAKKTISLSRGRTLSGHTWFTARKFLILNLSSLHPSGKPYLGYSTRRWSTLLGDSLEWSDYESDCSALFTPTRTSSRRRCIANTRRLGTSCGGYDPRYSWQTTWAARARGGLAHKKKTYGARYCSACITRHHGRYPEDAMRSIRICWIP